MSRVMPGHGPVDDLLARAFGTAWTASPWNSDELLREELFSIERLEQHAASLAVAQQITARPAARRPLAVRLRHNESVLLAAYRAIAKAVAEGRAVTPAAEWLLDNYHLVEEQIREIRQDLPPGFYRQLPKLADGPFTGYPRVFGLAWAFIAHTDSRFDPETLRRFLRSYQRAQPLTIGELWAVAITLRIVLVENLRRAALRSVNARSARQEADLIADRLLGLNGQQIDPGALHDRQDRVAVLPTDFAAQLVQRLRDQDPQVTPAVLWLEERLTAQGSSAAAIVREEHQRQGASNVTVRNIITSMRLMSDVDWAELFESVNPVDDALRAHSRFAAMDFATRNLYRSAIEELARHSSLSELQITEQALLVPDRPKPADGEFPDADRAQDPGYRLIGAGRRAFERVVGYRPPLRRQLGRFTIAGGIRYYITAIILVAAIVLLLPLLLLGAVGLALPWLALLTVLGAIPALDAAVAFVNRLVTRNVGATVLPGLALRDGVPAELRTIVVVPILLTSHEALAEQIQGLEIHHLASPEGELYFALLSDWPDSPAESVPGDASLLAAAAAGIARLNGIHEAGAGGPRFLLLHRRRLWSESEQQWMGWERKRGKLHELNQLLRGATDTTFRDVTGQSPLVPPDVRFVITLDADTRLPRDAARRLIGKLAHPLNRPRFDQRKGLVVEGYAVLQPRVTPSLPVGRESSIFQRVFSSTPGIDPYAAAASDVYQDLFGEGSYTGKGIYDIDAFEAALAGRVAADSLLSHDLFEGTYARAALVSDVEVVEDFPERYDVASRRQHRWARGDWQLLPWIFGRGDAAAPDRGGRGGRGALPLIGRWKMLDNLRRSLSAPAAAGALFTGWLLPAPAALRWTMFILAILALPVVLPALASVVPRRTGVSTRSHARAFGLDLRLAAAHVALLVIFLAHQAWSASDAICRSLFRLLISQRNLLEWVTAAQSSSSARLTVAGMGRYLGGGVAIGVAACIATWNGGVDSGWISAPFAILWTISPVFAWWVSRTPAPARHHPAHAADAQELRRIARRTWRYFEAFVTADDHLLPPDNFQEDPLPVVAHRTSPTNIGLYLLAVVSARDFGWLGSVATADRLEATLATMNRMDRHRGHFYNWYDTRNLRPLEPRYVSSVDSGNLAAHLIAVGNACREWTGTAPATAEWADGAVDALLLARDAAAALPVSPPELAALRAELASTFDALETTLRSDAAAAGERAAHVATAALHATALGDIARALGDDSADAAFSELIFWLDATRQTIASFASDAALGDDGRRRLKQRLDEIAADAQALAAAMDFAFLLNRERRLLSIGYRPADGTLDPNCYDLLASEARLASFVAIAKGDLPARHWFRLGRPVTPVAHGAALISWSGSMFEYLMPSLVMRAPSGSLLEQTNRLIVQRQIGYAVTLGVPWGISESAYHARDLELTYQYSNFGVPGLGLKRGLRENIVIAPYATALAAMVDPAAAARNFRRLAAAGALGRYGYYESLDYTPTRLPDGASVAIVRAFMAHHQGMTVVSIANALLDGRMRERFHSQPSVQATQLLLQERTPRDVSVAHPRAEEVATAARLVEPSRPDVRRIGTPHDVTPQVHLLSNGRYAVLLTAAGSGYSRWNDLAITRWRADGTREDFGAFLLLRDIETGVVWSAGFQPSGVEPDSCTATFTEDRAELVRQDGPLATTLEVLVSPEDDTEVRRLSISNGGFWAREIEVTSYSELVLAPSPPTSPIRRSPNCSCRRNSSLRWARLWLRGAGGHRPSSRSGPPSMRSSRARS